MNNKESVKEPSHKNVLLCESVQSLTCTNKSVCLLYLSRARVARRQSGYLCVATFENFGRIRMGDFPT